MERDNIERLLRQADRAAGGAPTIADGLGDRVRLRWRRRRRMRTIGASLAAALALATIGTLAVHRIGETSIGHGYTQESLRQQLDEIAREAGRIRVELAAAPVAAPMIAANNPPSAADPATADNLDQQLERTAYLAVYQGDRYARELGLPQAASASYQETIRLFPQTRAAQTAKARLAELKHTKEQAL